MGWWWDWIRAIFLNLFYFKAHSGGQIRENSSFEEQKQPLTSGSSAFNQANQQTGNVATSSTSGQTASEAANAPPPPFLPPSHIQSSQQNNFQQAAVCFRVSRVIEFLLWHNELFKVDWSSASQFQVCFKSGIQINLDLKSLIPDLNLDLKSWILGLNLNWAKKQ